MRPTKSSERGERGPRRAGATALASVLGFVAASGLGGAVLWSSGCQGDDPPGPSSAGSGRTSLPSPPSADLPPPSAAPDSSARPSTSAAAPDAPPEPPAVEAPYTGPLLGAMAMQTSVWPSMSFAKQRLGYVRHGGKVPVDPKPIKAENCAKGWYKLVDGGYVCGKWATLDLKDPQVRLGISSPDLDDLLPYKYAYNAHHGTPLYKSVPSREDMLRYEPYLDKTRRAPSKKPVEETETVAENAEASAPVPTDGAAGGSATERVGTLASAAALGLLDAGSTPSDEDPGEASQPWWQRTEPGKPLSVTLADLEQEADGTVSRRMVKGFFIAIDKSFGWNKRTWYKTTSGLVAPSDRMYVNKPPASQGMDVPAGVRQVGFITSGKGRKYEFDAEKTKVEPKGKIDRFTPVPLTGVTHSHKSTVYRQTTEGWWMKGAEGTYTDPGPPPGDLAPGEKWVDVNITRKTIMAFEGDKPVYAALVSPGKKHRDKKKDHRTPTGTYRIREKHITAKMDGDGAVAGDLPYSIEDVPYVAYYDRSYALHGAFWHNDFGSERSHGCVNLAPLDAKRIFFWTEPKLPRGWHGVWATAENRGTLVVVHE